MLTLLRRLFVIAFCRHEFQLFAQIVGRHGDRVSIVKCKICDRAERRYGC